MMHTQYAAALRRAIKRAMGAGALQTAQATRPSGGPFGEAAPQSLGTLTGYRYRARSQTAGVMLGMPGELADGLGDEWFMDLTDGLPVQIAENDTLTFGGGDSRRVSAVRGSGGFTGKDIYRLYKLEAV